MHELAAFRNRIENWARCCRVISRQGESNLMPALRALMADHGVLTVVESGALDKPDEADAELLGRAFAKLKTWQKDAVKAWWIYDRSEREMTRLLHCMRSELSSKMAECDKAFLREVQKLEEARDKSCGLP